MTRHASIAIDDTAAEFIDAQIDAGHFASPSDVINAGLRLLEQREAKVKALREALEEGEQSGYVENFNFDDFLTEMRQQYEAKQARSA